MYLSLAVFSLKRRLIITSCVIFWWRLTKICGFMFYRHILDQQAYKDFSLNKLKQKNVGKDKY